jgi:hypothetical protein
MIYMLRGLYDMVHEFTGQWWFDTQEPHDHGPVPALTNSGDGYWQTVEEDSDDKTPLPPPIGEGLPGCVSCGDPNFSLDNDLCICCRIGMR